MPHIIAIDQGTTSTRAIVFDASARAGRHARSRSCARFIRSPAGSSTTRRRSGRRASRPCAMRWRKAGARGQGRRRASASPTSARPRSSGTARPAGRSTTPSSGRTAAPPRPARRCARPATSGRSADRTGLVLDPYFSATKIAWLLDNVDGARAAAGAGAARLRHGRQLPAVAADRRRGARTDATNAARTLLFDIRRGAWDDELAGAFRVPAALLPEVRDCAADFGATEPELFGGAIRDPRHRRRPAGGDHRPGLLHARHDEVDLRHRLLCAAQHRRGAGALAPRLLTTIAYQLGGQRTYALEGAIFIAGAAVQWLRDGLARHRRSAPRSTRWRDKADPAEQVYLVPAFVGLGAPHWDAQARGALFGLTRDSRPGRDRAGGAGSGRLPDPRPARGDARRLARLRPAPCFGSMAA